MQQLQIIMFAQVVSLNSNVQYSMCHVMFIDYTNSDLCNATTGKTHITGQVIYVTIDVIFYNLKQKELNRQ